jgi:hypothetical protein
MKGAGIDDANEASLIRSLLKGETRVRNIWEPHAERLLKKGFIRQEGPYWILAVSREEAEAAVAVEILGRDR